MWGPKLDSTTTSSQQQQSSSPPPQEAKKNHLEDSGQIDSGFLSSEQILQSFNDTDYDQEEATAPPPPATGDLPQKQQKQPVDTYLDSGLVEDVVEEEEEDTQQQPGEMLLERELDNGLAEWLCTLDLKNNSPSPAINNLGGGGRSKQMDSSVTNAMNINNSDNKQNASSQRSTAASCEMIVPEEEQPWEMCYKQDAEGDTYLHMAVTEGAEDIVRDLIRITPHPCLLDIQNDLLQSPLHLAVLAGNVRLVRMLLLAGAESSIRDKYGNTPLHLACAAGDLDCVRALTERITATEEVMAVSCTGVLVPETKNKKSSSQQTVKRMHLVQYADVELRNYEGERCVHIAASVTSAAKNAHVDVMRQLVVRSGADVNAREGKAGFTALHMAVERGDKDLVRFLLDECTNVNLEVASYGRWTAYQIATVNRNQELMSMLRSKGAEALDVSSSEEESDAEEEEESEMILYGGGASGMSSFFNDQTTIMPLVGY